MLIANQLSIQDIFPDNIIVPHFGIGDIVYSPIGGAMRMRVVSITHDGIRYCYVCETDDEMRLMFECREEELFSYKDMDKVKSLWYEIKSSFRHLSKKDMDVTASKSFALLYYKPQKRGTAIQRIHNVSFAIVNDTYLYKDGTGMRPEMRAVDDVYDQFAKCEEEVKNISNANILELDPIRVTQEMFYDKETDSFKSWDTFSNNEEIMRQCRRIIAA